MAASLSAIVLAGGVSSRLGSDKAALRFDDKTLLCTVIERLQTVCDEIILACGQHDPPCELSSPVKTVPDCLPGQGPLAGLHAGLKAATAHHAFLVACDMPFLDNDLLQYMASLPRTYEALVPRTKDGWHPLHAIYSRPCLAVVESLLAQGGNSMYELLSRVSVRAINEAEIKRHDPSGLALFNLNDSNDLSFALAHWPRRPSSAQSA